MANVETRKKNRRGKEKESNYPYAVARVKARKATLLPPAQFKKFLKMDIAAIIRFISESEYSKEISDLGTEYSGLDLVEYATYDNMARNFREVLGFCKGRLRTHIETYLGKWDIWNIKTIVRGLSFGATESEIMEDMVPAGLFSREELKRFISADDLDSLLEMLRGTEYHDVLAKNRISDGDVDLMKLENHLDSEYYLSLLDITTESKWLSRILERYFREKIDVVNLKLLFRLKYADLECDQILEFIIPGGHELSEEDLRRMGLAEDFESFVGELKDYRFWPSIKDEVEKGLERDTLNPIMSAIDRYHFETARKFGKLYPLSIMPFLDYFIWKRIEVDNIRIICRGKEAGLSNELINSMLIFD